MAVLGSQIGGVNTSVLAATPSVPPHFAIPRAYNVAFSRKSLRLSDKHERHPTTGIREHAPAVFPTPERQESDAIAGQDRALRWYQSVYGRCKAPWECFQLQSGERGERFG